MTFSLLQLPYLVFTDIINQLKSNELIILSLCSEKLRRLVMQHRYKSRKWSLFLHGFGDSSIVLDVEKPKGGYMSLGAHSDPGNISETISISGFHQVPCTIHRETGVLTTYWKDRADGLKAISAHIFDLLNITEIESFHCSPSSSWYFEWLDKRGITTRSTALKREIEEDSPIQGEQFSQIFRNCKSEILAVFCAPEERFHYDGSFNSYAYIYIECSFWVTIQTLNAMNSTTVVLGSSKLKSVDINQFLRMWLKMASPRLKLLMIELDGRFVFDEIDAEISNRFQFVRHEREYSVGHVNFKFHYSFDLRREEDGVTLTLLLQPLFTGNDQVRIVVWPDEMERTHRQNVQEIV